MSLAEIYQQFITGMSNTTWYEYVAVFAGIASVWYSRAENILVYPVGLINTIIYIYISFNGHLLGEAAVNFYYTIMSISGWYMWTRKDQRKEIVLHITYSNKKEWLNQIAVMDFRVRLFQSNRNRLLKFFSIQYLLSDSGMLFAALLAKFAATLSGKDE